MDIDLMDVEAIGVVVPCQGTGITYTSQCGGTGCGHPKVEGFYVPLPSQWLDLLYDRGDAVRDFWLTGPVADGRAFVTATQQFLLQLALDDCFEQALDYTGERGEAWIPLRVVSTPDEYVLRPLYDQLIFLTYPNSD